MKESFKKLSFIGITLVVVSLGILGAKNNEIKVMAENEKEVSYKKYSNERFGFSGVYPDFLTEKFESENGDGIILKDKDNEVILIMSGINNILNETSETLLEDEKKNKAILYEEKGEDYYVLSYSEGGKIKYNYRSIGKGSIQGLVIEYPKEKERKFKNIVKRIKDEFKSKKLDSFS